MDMHAAQIGWMEDRQPRFSAAMLLIAYRDGLLILADAMPPEGCRVVLRVPGISPRYWIEARTVATSKLRSGPYEIRLGFTALPSRAFLAAMMIGRVHRN